MTGTGARMSADCPFCSIGEEHRIAANALAFAVRDASPVSPGHSLVIPRRHVQSFFECTPEERAAMMALLDEVRAVLGREHAPDGYNIGLNEGAAAGQTVMHVHLHLMPRYRGDRADPRGGVRWIFPDRAAYWAGNRNER